MADFDSDGMPDLLAAYAGEDCGRLDLLRGNPYAVYPGNEDEQAPFFPDPAIFTLSAVPDFLLIGDVNGDGNQDAVFATLNESRFFFALGDGNVELEGTLSNLAEATYQLSFFTNRHFNILKLAADN